MELTLMNSRYINLNLAQVLGKLFYNKLDDECNRRSAYVASENTWNIFKGRHLE